MILPSVKPTVVMNFYYYVEQQYRFGFTKSREKQQKKEQRKKKYDGTNCTNSTEKYKTTRNKLLYDFNGQRSPDSNDIVSSTCTWPQADFIQNESYTIPNLHMHKLSDI